MTFEDSDKYSGPLGYFSFFFIQSDFCFYAFLSDVAISLIVCFVSC